MQQIPASSDGDTFFYKVRVGDDDSVHLEVLHQRQRIVVGLDENGPEAGGQQAGTTQGCHGLCREDMGADDGGEAALEDVVAEALAVDLVGHVDGRLDSA